jgi:hypothetical protein
MNDYNNYWWVWLTALNYKDAVNWDTNNCLPQHISTFQGAVDQYVSAMKTSSITFPTLEHFIVKLSTDQKVLKVIPMNEAIRMSKLNQL